MESQPIYLNIQDIRNHTENLRHIEEFENLFLCHSNHIEDVFAIRNHFYLESIGNKRIEKSQIEIDAFLHEFL